MSSSLEGFQYRDLLYWPGESNEYQESGSGFSSGASVSYAYSSSSGNLQGDSAAYSVSSAQAGGSSSGSNENAVVQQVTSDLLQLSGSSSGGLRVSSSGAFGAAGSSSGAFGAAGSSSGAFGAARSSSGSFGAAGSYSGSFGGASSSSGALQASAFSQVEQDILNAANPLDFNETELITINGQTGLWSNRQEVINWRGVIPITQYYINQDENPEVIQKRTQQKLLYEQEFAVRYLRPPTPPPPGEILIRQEKNIVTPPAPPLVIRQQPPRPETPPPLVVREAPPRPPAAVGQKLISISGKRLPPPPRKVVIERLAPLPSKPQSVIIERWLPYSENKRRVIFTKPTEPDPVIPRPRNVIVQWEAPEVVIKKEFRDLGVIRANPVEYVQRYGASLKTHHELPQFVKEIRPPAGVVLAAEHVSASIHALEGDLHALNLIDLDREGLSEYRSYLAQYSAAASAAAAAAAAAAASSSSSSYSVSYSSQSEAQAGSLSASVSEAFAQVDLNSDGRISRSEAQKVLLRLNSRLGRSYGEDELNIFFSALDVNNDGAIDVQEFRNALLKRYAL